jgi:phytoene desaturase
VRQRFSDPHLVQLFERFATYNGSSPYQTPATFNVIPYVENAFGAWYPEGGIRALAEWLTSALTRLGVEIHTETVATLYDGTTLQTDTGHTWKPDAVICNGEVPGAYERWIRHSGFRHVQKKVEPEEWSLSGFVLLLGVNRKFPHLRHHNIFFSRDYPEEFRQLFEERRLPEDPTIYINISSCTTPEDAPDGHDNYFILVNAPAETREIDWAKRSPVYQRHILSKLEAMGLDGLSRNVVYAKTFTPADFGRRDLSTGGALYGAASHGIRASILRPPIVSPHDPKLFFVGGSTHPGGGIPLVLLSAKMTSEAVMRKYGN